MFISTEFQPARRLSRQMTQTVPWWKGVSPPPSRSEGGGEPFGRRAPSNLVVPAIIPGLHQTGAIWYRPGNLKCLWRAVVGQLAT